MKPFLRWAGGKRRLADQIIEHMPPGPIDYVEPFVGGGALFLRLLELGRLRRVVLADRNPEIVAVWSGLLADPAGVAERQSAWPSTRASYDKVRAIDWRGLDVVDVAARAIWLNRHCFNGLYRLNRAGRFNVPFGNRESPPPFDLENAKRIAEAAAAVPDGVAIRGGDFAPVVADALARRSTAAARVVYLDPPYVGTWGGYDGGAFTAYDQRRVVQTMMAVSRRGGLALASNSLAAAPFYEFSGVERHALTARRSIAAKAAARGEAAELLAVAAPLADLLAATQLVLL